MRNWFWTVVSSALVSVVGMFTYRLGAAYNIPYGLFLSLAVVGVSCYLAGVRGGIWHQFLHALISTVIVWAMAFASSSASTVVAMGGTALITFWSQKASIIWLYGIIVIQIVVVLLPRSLYNAVKD